MGYRRERAKYTLSPFLQRAGVRRDAGSTEGLPKFIARILIFAKENPPAIARGLRWVNGERLISRFSPRLSCPQD